MILRTTGVKTHVFMGDLVVECVTAHRKPPE
jgi:hypothetical protein